MLQVLISIHFLFFSFLSLTHFLLVFFPALADNSEREKERDPIEGLCLLTPVFPITFIPYFGYDPFKSLSDLLRGWLMDVIKKKATRKKEGKKR